MSDYLDPSEMLPALGGGGYLDQSEMEAGPAPAKGNPNISGVSPTETSNPLLAAGLSLNNDFGRMQEGVGKSVLDTLRGLWGVASDPNAAVEGAAKGYKHQLWSVPSRLRDAASAAGEGTPSGAASALGGVGNALAAVIPGEDALMATGSRMIGGDPEAGGELAGNLAQQAAGAGKFSPIIGGATRAVAESAPFVGMSAAAARARSLFKGGAKVDEAWRAARPSVMAGDANAFTREGVEANAAGDAERAGAALESARNSAKARGVRVNLEPAIDELSSKTAKVTPRGTTFGPEFANEATTTAQKLDELARGGADAVRPPPAPAPRPTLLDASGHPIQWPEPDEWQPPPRRPVPISDALDAYDAQSKRIPAAAYVKGPGEVPRTDAMESGRSGMSDALKASDPGMAKAMAESNRALSVRDLVDQMRPAAGTWGKALVGGIGSTAAHFLGADAPTAAAIGVGVAGLKDFMQSPAWKLIGAAKQQRIAALLQAGKIAPAVSILNDVKNIGQVGAHDGQL